MVGVKRVDSIVVQVSPDDDRLEATVECSINEENPDGENLFLTPGFEHTGATFNPIIDEYLGKFHRICTYTPPHYKDESGLAYGPSFWIGVKEGVDFARRAFIATRDQYASDRSSSPESWGVGGHSVGALTAVSLLADPTLNLENALLIDPVPGGEDRWMTFPEKLKLTAGRIGGLLKFWDRDGEGNLRFRPRVEQSPLEYQQGFMSDLGGRIPDAAAAVPDHLINKIKRPESLWTLVTALFGRPKIGQANNRTPLAGKTVTAILGEEDPFVRVSDGKRWIAILSKLGASVETFTLPCNHSGLIYDPKTCLDEGMQNYLSHTEGP